MDTEDYERLPTSSVAVHMTAGACAGIFEHSILYPLDSVKTRMQALTPGPGGGGGIWSILVKMIQQEGLFRPIRGMSVMIAGAGPAHALYFSCYEFLKNKLINTRIFSQFNHPIYGLAGCIATLLHDGVMNPAEVVKQRMQMYNSPYTKVFNCIQHVYKKEGIRAFYRSYTTQLAMNVPFQCIHFMSYEFVQSVTNPKHVYNPFAHIVSGAAAGAIAAGVTTPLDVCKTMLNTQQDGVNARGMVDAVKKVYRLGGLRGFSRGMTVRVACSAPATAICWSAYVSSCFEVNRIGSKITRLILIITFNRYEFCKYLLRDTQNDHGSEINDTNQNQNSSRTSFQGSSLYFNKNSPAPVLLEVTRS